MDIINKKREIYSYKGILLACAFLRRFLNITWNKNSQKFLFKPIEEITCN